MTNLKEIFVPVMGVEEDSVVDGEGLRFALFVQGCPHHCKGCHNPQSWGYKRDNMMSLDELYRKIDGNPLCSGLTLSGGEPFMYPKELSALAKAVRTTGRSVWSFSGWTFEQLMAKDDAWQLLEQLDVLVDGRFELDKRDLSLKFRGSWNQRVIDVPKTLATGIVTLLYPDVRLLVA